MSRKIKRLTKHFKISRKCYKTDIWSHSVVKAKDLMRIFAYSYSGRLFVERDILPLKIGDEYKECDFIVKRTR